MFDPLVRFGMSNPVMGTCAGLILMAEVVNDDINVIRKYCYREAISNKLT